MEDTMTAMKLSPSPSFALSGSPRPWLPTLPGAVLISDAALSAFGVEGEGGAGNGARSAAGPNGGVGDLPSKSGDEGGEG
eukprot:4593708-Pleurochrysis_carterae.AAC.5